MGSGICSISQLTVEAVAWIEAADVVCYVLADPLSQRWVQEHARQAEDLARLHRPDRPRLEAYQAMSDRLVEHARAGRLVVGVFYGHPGVFTSPSHWAVRAARSEGIPARMLAAVSAEDCLFADLGVDPGDGACQSFEATDMIIKAREPAVDAHLIVWQVGVVGQRGLGVGGSRVDELVSYLARFYPADHLVTHYQAAQSVIAEPLVQVVGLAELASLPLSVTSTLYVPPLATRDWDLELAAALGLDGSTPMSGAGSAAGRRETEQPDSAAGDEPATLPDPADWYRPVATHRSGLADLLTSVSTDPSLLEAVQSDPRPYLGALGLDVIEAWAFLARDQTWIAACLQEGSGPAAAVALGAAASEEEARSFFIHTDGRLVRRRPDTTPAATTPAGSR